MTIADIRMKQGVRATAGPRGEAWWFPLIMFWGLLAVIYVYVGAEIIADGLADTDMAMRLVEVRDFLAGQGWYDLSVPRLAPGEGYVSHWSRLVDAGLAALLAFFSLFLPPPQAELAMRVAWPLLMLLPAMVAVTLIAMRLAGSPRVAFLTAALVTLSLPARFYVGDIDHHGIQIAILMSAWAALALADRSRLAAFASGLLVALSMAVSLEAVPFLGPLLGVVLFLYVKRGTEALPVLQPHLAGLLLGALGLLALAVPPSRWMAEAACDAYAPNWGLPLAAAALLGLIVLRLPAAARGWQWRAGLLLLPVGVAAALFVAYDPACLKGPFAHMDPRLRPVWLDHVKEVSPLWNEGVHPGFKAIWAWSALVTMLWMVTVGWHRRAGAAGSSQDEASRPGSDLVVTLLQTGLAATVVLALVLALMAMRYAVFAQWLALPLMAAWLHGVLGRIRKRQALARLPVLLLVSPLFMVLVASLLAGSGEAANRSHGSTGKVACRSDRALATLNRAAPGLVATTIDMGPYVLARSHHSVLAAPYHRLGESMLDVSRIFTAPPEKARRVIERQGVDYVLYCKGMTTPRTLAGERPPVNALWFHLVRGRPPAWLEPVDLGGDMPLRLYRVRLGKAAEATERTRGRKDRTTPPLRQSVR